MPDLIFYEPVSLVNRADFNEEQLQKALIDNPERLGLGDIRVIDRERTQKEGGRLDILFESDDDVRYEVEIQLGKTDPSHIIRTIEYWDNEKRQYPSYDHVAVIVAENLTSRFWNVINILNQSLPLIAIQVSAFKTPSGELGLVFSKLLDRRQLAICDEESSIEAKIADRPYWEKKNSQCLAVADAMLALISDNRNANIKLSYVLGYIGFKVNNKTVNFASVEPRKRYTLIKIFAPQEAISNLIDQLSLTDIKYKDNYLMIRLNIEYLKTNSQVIKEILLEAIKARCQDIFE